MRDAYISRIYELAKKNKDLIFVTNEQGAASLDILRENLPNQFINAGISEQNIITTAAGLAYAGKRVIVYSIATFITLRCFEQIKIDLCVMKLPVTIVGVGTCYSYSTDGPTHHATEDISIMRSLANIEIFSPADAIQAHKLADYSLKNRNPVYIRLDREKQNIINNINFNPNNGFNKLSNGSKNCIISTSNMVNNCLEVVKILSKDKLKVKLIDMYKLKPLNKGLIKELKNITNIFTVEEHSLNGGLGSIISEFCSDNLLKVNIYRLGISDQKLYNYGERNYLHKINKIDINNIIKFIKKNI